MIMTVWRLTAIEFVFSVGMILGGIVMASWGGLKIGFILWLCQHLHLGLEPLHLE